MRDLGVCFFDRQKRKELLPQIALRSWCVKEIKGVRCKERVSINLELHKIVCACEGEGVCVCECVLCLNAL